MFVTSKVMRLNTTTICLIAIIAVFAVIILYLMMKKPNEEYGDVKGDGNRAPVGVVVNPAAGTGATAAAAAQPSPPAKDASNVPCLVLFHADWCPHCKHLLPAWDEVKKAVNGKFLIADIESKNPIMAHHQLPGFPTIRYFPEGLGTSTKFLEYSGDRSPKSILDFLSSCIQGK